MRLKTKIIFICCISILFSSIVCSAAVWYLVKSVSLNAAEAQSFKNAWTGFSELDSRISVLDTGKGEEIDEKVMEYFLKQQADEMLVCFKKTGESGTEIFNSTILEQSDFEKLQYHSVSQSLTLLEEAEMEWEGRHFYVYRQERGDSYTVYKLEDITYVWERMGTLGLALVILTCVITLFVCLCLFIILSRVLQPLRELSMGAKQIADGRYDERILYRLRRNGRKDEIGELSDNFNEMAEAVESRIRQLKDAEWRRTLFMGNLTHELKTPMTAISGYAKTLLTVKLPEEDKEEALAYIYEESCRLERLSGKMMNLLLLEETENIDVAEVTAKELFQHAAGVCRRSLEEDGVHLECHENGEIFLADTDLFTEVLINLIDNARKASREGDTVILSAKGNIIEVRDFGTGIPEEEKEKILEPFYMIDKSRSRKNGGAGLGLAITALILKRHNCKIEIESEVGQGTRVILQFV